MTIFRCSAPYLPFVNNTSTNISQILLHSITKEKLCCFIFGLTGAEHLNICRRVFAIEVKGAAHRNIHIGKLKFDKSYYKS
jgi:hypothetical protein